MHAELSHPRALVGDRTRAGRYAFRTVATVGKHAIQARLEILVHNVEADVGIGVEIELRTSTKCPGLEVVVAGHTVEFKRCTERAASCGFCRAEFRVGYGIVAGGGISAVD